VHGSRETVVRALTHVDVVVWVHLLAPHGTVEFEDGEVGDDLIAVHVGLGSGTSLVDTEGEMGVPEATEHLVSGGNDHVGFGGWNLSLLFVIGCATLQ